MPSRRPCLQKGVPFHLSEPGESRCAEHRLTKWASRAGTSMGPGWAATRKRKLQRDPRCQQCGVPAITVDHVLPRAFGGTDAPPNLKSLCARHAAEKNHRDAEEGKRRKRVAG
jgi:5-methylcytosine-specific restriction protein A